jgi:cob(I)alamin adenosyltransferase
MAANKNRGEQDLTVNDQTFTLVLTLSDLEAIESDLQMGAMAVLVALREQKASVGQVRTILRRGFRRVEPRHKPEQVNVLLDQVPFTTQYSKALMLLAGALNMLDEQQDRDPEKEEIEESGDAKPPL